MGCGRHGGNRIATNGSGKLQTNFQTALKDVFVMVESEEKRLASAAVRVVCSKRDRLHDLKKELIHRV